MSFIYNIKNISFKKIKNAQACFADQQYITDISTINFGNKLTSTCAMFYDCYNLITIPNFNTINVTNMSDMFKYCYNLTEIPNLNTSNVTNMSNMFYYCNNLTDINLYYYQLNNINDMSSIFSQCKNLNSVHFSNIYNLTNLHEAFSNCTNLQTISGTAYNTAKNVDCSYMFQNCYNLINTLALHLQIENASHMYENCYNIEGMAMTSSYINDASYMYANCKSITSLGKAISGDSGGRYIGTWNNLSYLFYNCINLKYVNHSGSTFNFDHATDMTNMFLNCNNLTADSLNQIVNKLPPINQLNNPFTNTLSYIGFSDFQIYNVIFNSKVTNIAKNNGWNIVTTTNYNIGYKTNPIDTIWTLMDLNNIQITNNAWAIKNCFNANIPNKNMITNLKVNSLPIATNLSYLFNNMYNLQEVNELNIPEATDISYIFTNCRNLTNISNFNTSNVINMCSMFNYCKNLTTIPNFNTINVTNMSYMFMHSGLTNAPNFDTSNVIDMSWMFKSCSILANIPNFNTINVTNMTHMFYSCTNIITIPNFNTINVTNMSDMFTQCRNLTTVPNFNTSKVTNMSGMFYGCSNLTNIPNFNTNNVVDIAEMFSYCNSLIEVFNFNTNNVVNIANMFYACYNLSNNSLENIAYSIPYYSNITDTNKWPMLNYIGLSETQINNLSAAAVEFVESRGWFVQPQIKIEYTLLNGYSGNNRMFINGMNGIEQCQNLSNIIVADTQNNAVTLNILGTSSNIELINLLNDKGRYLTDLNFGINTINTTNGYRAFELCHNLKNINGLKTNNIINGYLMFSNCENLQPSWNEWNFNNVINGTQMFCNIGGFIYNFSIPNLSFANLDCATAMFRSVLSNYANITDVSSNIYMPKVTDMGLIFASCSNLSLNALQNIVTFIPDYTQLNSTTKASSWSDWDNSYYGTLQYLGLSIEQIDLLPDKYKQMAADKHWNVPGFIAREKASVLPICNNLGAISNYISNNSYTEIPMILSYKDEYKDYCLESQNQGTANSTSSAIITIPEELIALCGNEYTFTFYYSGETNCDYLTIYRNGTEIKKCNGNNGSVYLQDTLYLEDVIAGDIFQFTFRKDGSANTGLDGCLIFITGYKGEKAYEITYSLVEDPDTLLYKIIPKEEN